MLVIHRRGDRGTPPQLGEGEKTREEWASPATAPASHTLPPGMNLAARNPSRIFSSDWSCLGYHMPYLFRPCNSAQLNVTNMHYCNSCWSEPTSQDKDILV